MVHFHCSPLYFLTVISAADEQRRALGLDVAPSTNMALCIIKHCMWSPEETHIMFCIFVVRAVHKCATEVGDRNPTLIAREENSHLSHFS